ncbi:MAG: Hsp20/alpha crystallin family protein [Gammaproteobacteria bacterium]
MSLIRYQPWGVMRSLQEDIDRLFENRFAQDETVASTASWAPPVDIREEDDRFVIHADVPGIDPGNIDVTMENGILTISGSREDVDRTEKEGYRRVERVTGRFFRRFTLPDTANPEAISAKSRNGVLEVIIPKQAQVMPRKISVEVN